MAGIPTEFRFHALRLWENAERIRSGELRELAPLLVLCEDKPTERTLQEERELILGMDAPQSVRLDLLGLAITVAGRYFTRDLVQAIFREEIEMARSAGLVEDWIAEGEARGEARGMAQGEAQGKTREAQQFLVRLLRKKFGDLPPALMERIIHADAAWCEEIGERMVDGRSLDDLFG